VPSYVLCFVELVGVHGTDHGPMPEPGQFLRSYDPDANDGYGNAVWTNRLSEALHFDDAIAAYDFYMAQSKVRPLRSDGHANRPLSAYTVEGVAVVG
jgi:hypothetical protein